MYNYLYLCFLFYSIAKAVQVVKRSIELEESDESDQENENTHTQETTTEQNGL